MDETGSDLGVLGLFEWWMRPDPNALFWREPETKKAGSNAVCPRQISIRTDRLSDPRYNGPTHHLPMFPTIQTTDHNLNNIGSNNLPSSAAESEPD